MAAPILDPNAPAFTRRYMNLADPRLGAQALFASDEFFAPKERMLNPEPAVFIPGKYDDHGKWMDGWETRRKRTTGHDFCVIRLARPGVVHGVDLDTSHFTGNFPPAASIDACSVDGDTPPDDAAWRTIVPATTLQGNAHHYVSVSDAAGHASAREPVSGRRPRAAARVRSAAARLARRGGRRTRRPGRDRERRLPGGGEQPALRCGVADADAGARREHGRRLGNAAPPRARQRLGDRRARAAGRHPARRRRYGILQGQLPGPLLAAGGARRGRHRRFARHAGDVLAELLGEQKLQMDRVHTFDQLAALGPVTHVRFNIFPDGGVSRLRLWGEPA
jgi:allantoicase